MSSDFFFCHIYSVEDIRRITGISKEIIIFDILMGFSDLDCSSHYGRVSGLFSPWQVLSYYVKKRFNYEFASEIDDMLDELSDQSSEQEVLAMRDHDGSQNILPRDHLDLPCTPAIKSLSSALPRSNLNPVVTSRIIDFLKRLYAFEVRESWEATVASVFTKERFPPQSC